MDINLARLWQTTSHAMSRRLMGHRLHSHQITFVCCICQVQLSCQQCCAYQLLSFSTLLLLGNTLLQPSQHVVLLIAVNSDVLLRSCSSLKGFGLIKLITLKKNVNICDKYITFSISSSSIPLQIAQALLKHLNYTD